MVARAAVATVEPPRFRPFELLLDALLMLALVGSIPFIVLLIGAPLALALRALLWLIERF